MSDQPDLQKLQRWMMSVITNPLGAEEGIGSDEARKEIETSAGEIEDVIQRSQALTSIERLDVYSNGYYARLLECMQSFFPGLLYALTEDVFNQFTMGYLQNFPPHSYTLNRLADHFVEYLEATRPDSDSDSDLPADWPEFLIDLARLELAIDRVFDGPGFESSQTLRPEDLQGVDPDDWPSMRLRLAECLCLLEFKFPVNDYYSEYRRGDEPTLPDPEVTFAALSRLDYVVHRFNLSRDQHALLSVLDEGATIGEAIEQVAEITEDLDSLAENLQQWFFTWAEHGFFHSVCTP